MPAATEVAVTVRVPERSEASCPNATLHILPARRTTTRRHTIFRNIRRIVLSFLSMLNCTGRRTSDHNPGVNRGGSWANTPGPIIMQPLRHGCRATYPGVTETPPSQGLPRIPTHRRGLYTARRY